MSILIPITLVGWIAVAVVLFGTMPPRRAVLWAYLAAWLFLPQAALEVPGLPDLDKMNATSLGALIGVALFDARRLTGFRPAWVDLPIIVYCLSPIPASLSNGLGVYDGLAEVSTEVFAWGLPYLMGRLYFNDLAGLRALAMGIFIGGVIYVPLCLYEIRMSPQLHNMLYGYHPSAFAMTLRFGGYRPMVFMQHGLMLAMWMTSASLVGVWLWRTKAVRRLFKLPVGVVVVILLATTILCKSTGALALLAMALAVLMVNRHLRSSAVIAALTLAAPAYMFVRAEGLWSGQQLIELSEMVSTERADSLAGRLQNEDLIIAKASQKPWFGWGGWGRWRVFDPWTGKDITVSDGMWVIVRGEAGLMGLASLTATILLPVLLLLRRIPARHWSLPATAAPAALAILLMLYSIDNLFNAMVNPIFILAAGGITGMYVTFPRLVAQARKAVAGAAHRPDQPPAIALAH